MILDCARCGGGGERVRHLAFTPSGKRSWTGKETDENVRQEFASKFTNKLSNFEYSLLSVRIKQKMLQHILNRSSS